MSPSPLQRSTSGGPGGSAQGDDDPGAAVLVAVQLPGVSDEQHAADLGELRRLVTTLGYRTVGTVSQKRQFPSRAAVLGRGKLAELAAYTGGSGVVPSAAPEVKNKVRARQAAEADGDSEGELEPEYLDDGEDGDDDVAAAVTPAEHADVVVVDHEITPSQARNLERATGAVVLDRTGVIVEIFHRHARSREAKLEVEIARLSYVAPRLREAGAGRDKQRGGNVKRGAGESALELDRRKIRDRLAELRQELSAVQRDQARRRQQRRDHRRVALVGYTNAGKSSLMRALTGSEVLVADKLFATLDTTVRALHPETRPRLLVSDTVGFIKKLPHDLVASFRSTLDEALEASLLLYVTDASDPTFRQQLEVTRTVLGEIGATEVPAKLLLNKVDRLSEAEREALRAEFGVGAEPGEPREGQWYDQAILLSARDPADVTTLRASIIAWFERFMTEGELLVPYGKQSLLGEVYEGARVLAEDYDEAGAHLRVRAHPATLGRLRSLLAD